MCLKEEDKNTKFFHNMANQRKKVNEIEDDDGVWWRGKDKVQTVIVSYFSNLFASPSPTNVEDTS